MSAPEIKVHERRLMLDHDLVMRADAWHGGQSSSLYSLVSCGIDGLVSVAMIRNAIGELEACLYHALSEPRTARVRRDRADLRAIIGDLDMVAAYPEGADYADSGAWEGDAFESDGLHDEDDCDHCPAVAS